MERTSQSSLGYRNRIAATPCRVAAIRGARPPPRRVEPELFGESAEGEPYDAREALEPLLVLRRPRQSEQLAQVRLHQPGGHEQLQLGERSAHHGPGATREPGERRLGWHPEAGIARRGLSSSCTGGTSCLAGCAGAVSWSRMRPSRGTEIRAPRRGASGIEACSSLPTSSSRPGESIPARPRRRRASSLQNDSRGFGGPAVV